MGNNAYIIELLQEGGFLQTEEGQRLLNEAQAAKISVIDHLVESGYAASAIQKTLANQFGMETIELVSVDISLNVIELVSFDIAVRYRIIPIRLAGSTLTIAIGDPLDFETIDTLRYLLAFQLEVLIALPEEIDAAIVHFYSGVDTPDQPAAMQVDSTEVINGDDFSGTDSEADEPIIKLVNMIILEGYRARASDIHLEPLTNAFRVRYRIDGVLRAVEGPPLRLHPSVISRLKIMSGMKISEKRLPQDGRIEIKRQDRPLDLRVSCIPSNHGESIVMRILDKEGLMLGLPHLGFFPDDQETFERLIRLPDGILLITGPTGSGKTTTLYSCLNAMNQPSRKIITVEDPVEYQLSGINQVQVRSDINLTFSRVLRSILRQAPNIIMIGEIRDRETAEIAVNAALTGHLVLSTLHTNDAPSAVTRLVDIGVKPFLVSSSVRGIMAQRLVRTICPACKQEYTPQENELYLFESTGYPLGEAKLFHGEGCSECNETGYKVRKGIFELLTVNDEIRQLIYGGFSASELRIKARERGMRTLREDGFRKAFSGVTTLNEVLRVTMRDES